MNSIRVQKDKYVLVLSSGGIDSSACISFYKNQGFFVEALFCNYAQLSATNESEAATQICSHYKIPLQTIRCLKLRTYEGGYIPGRNTFFLSLALMHFQQNMGLIALGIHSDTPYADCSVPFIRQMQSIFDIYTEGRVGIGAPFLDWSKCDIWNYCRSEKVPLELTYSCELGKKQPCGQCLSCKDLEVLHAR